MLTIQSSPWLGIDVLRGSLQIRDMAASTRPRESSLRDFHGRLGRARDVLRQEGVRVLSIKILGETLYRRLLIMELPLDRELSTIGARLPLTIQALAESDLDAYLKFRPDTSRAEIERRIGAGCHCFVAMHESVIVHAGWATAGEAWIDYLGCEMPLMPGDVYQFDSFTAPEFRGRGAARARIETMAGLFRGKGYRRLLAGVLPENAPAFRTLASVGYRPIGRIRTLSVGRWRSARISLLRTRLATPSHDVRNASGYWDDVFRKTRQAPESEVWRAYMRRVYVGLLQRWRPSPGSGIGLKTDLFEEAVGADHLLTDLGTGSIGLDCSLSIACAARARVRRAAHGHGFVVGDLRDVPFRTGSIRRILAGSSHDHFADHRSLEAALAELTRILAPGGTLILTLDNPENPIVWVRNHLPFSWLNRIGLVPYFVGRTYGGRAARHVLESCGLVVTSATTVAHVPRAPAIWLAALARRTGRARLASALAHLLWSFEALERWPTRRWTGYYVALCARKPEGAVEST